MEAQRAKLQENLIGFYIIPSLLAEKCVFVREYNGCHLVILQLIQEGFMIDSIVKAFVNLYQDTTGKFTRIKSSSNLL